MKCEVCNEEFKPKPTPVTAGYNVVKVCVDDGELVPLKVCPNCYNEYEKQRKEAAIEKFKNIRWGID